MSLDLIVVDDAEAASRRVGELLAEAAHDGGHIALSGGKSPELAHEAAARLQPDWSRVELWWGDERCVPPEDERSNFRLARENLLDHLGAPPREVQRIRGEVGADEAAREYDRLLRAGPLDFVLLGIGPDGHTASLYPDQPTLDERERLAIPAEAKLEPFVDRVTLTVPALTSAPAVVFIVTGGEKSDAVERAFGRPPDRTSPASLIRSAEGRTLVVADEAATAGLHA